MQFTYTYLKSAEMNGVTVGHYKGYDVVPTTKENLAKSGESDRYIYLIYDDNNLLYKDGKVFGNVDRNGDVTEFTSRRYLLYDRKKEEDIPRAESSESAPAADDDISTSGNNEIIADVALEALVEDTLKDAREMSIDGLLKGFEYGL